MKSKPEIRSVQVPERFERISVGDDDLPAPRADRFLAARLPGLSRAAVQRAFDAGLVRRNGVSIAKSARLSLGDVVDYRIPETRPAELEPAEIPLEILYEDEDLLALNKPVGMVVHPGAGTGGDTLVHALLAHCRGKLSGIGGVERPGIVHRLDRETSGVMLVAKNDRAHQGLAKLFSSRELLKEYLAMVAGVPSLRAGTIRQPIGRNPTHRHKMAILDSSRGGREARTDWLLQESFPPVCSLIRCRIHSGRTHQIRVHLSALRHPILGDTTYGYRPDGRLPIEPPRVMLHAEHLKLHHPLTGDCLDLRAPLPEDFQRMLESLRHR